MPSRQMLVHLLLSMLAAACIGTETDNPAASNLTSFASSDCNKSLGSPAAVSSREPHAASVARQSLAVGNYDGLQCVRWQRTDASDLAIDLINFHAGCVPAWEGAAVLAADGTLELSLSNPSCAVGGCGWCIFDWTFEVNGLPEGQDLSVRIETRTCPSDDPTRTYELTLPLGTADEGVMCRPADTNALKWVASDRCGEHLMPCGGTPGCFTDTPCAADLSCSDLAQNEPRCLATCTTDADCPSPELLACRDGVCSLARMW